MAVLICVLLTLSIALVFSQSAGHPFVNFDDPDYVSGNEHVLGGLTAGSIGWAFTHRHSNNWHPLTSISHIIDCGLFAAWAGGHHLMNVLLHAATTIALFVFLRMATGHLWPGALAAALFAIHPLHVESVAWVSERKDVLSGLCFMLTLLAYGAYARHPFSVMRYLLVALLLTLGLLAKPMLVTLPFVLLLLDYWPLGRAGSGEQGAGSRERGAGIGEQGAGGAPAQRVGEQAVGVRKFPWRLVREKTPLFAICAAVSLGTLGSSAILPLR